MPGRKSVHAEGCFNGNFIGTGFGINPDLSKKLPDAWRAFSKEFIPGSTGVIDQGRELEEKAICKHGLSIPGASA